MDILLEALERESSVKAKKLLKEGFVPACLYGKGMETVELKVPLNKLNKIFAGHARTIDLRVGGKTWLVSIGEIQRDAVSRKPHHVSFQHLDKNEKSVFSVEVCLTGKPKEGLVDHLLHAIEIKGTPGQIPDRLEMDVSGLGIGEGLRVSDLAGEHPFEIVSSASEIIAKCRHLQVLEEPEEKAPDKPSEGVPEQQAAPVEECAPEEKEAA